MIRAIAVDDEFYNLEEICNLIEETGFMQVEGRCQNATEALMLAALRSPQVAFVDIEMPEMDGLTLAEKLLEQNPEIKIVFITGWNQYAVAAFELNALDYIMKPINKSRFNKMVERLKSEIGYKESGRSTSLCIQCFERFEVLKGGRPVTWQRIKAEELFCFLLNNHDVFIHKDNILENLWPDLERSKALPILQTSVCKIRNLFSEQKEQIKLAYADNKYGLFLENVACDLIDVENAIKHFHIDRKETYEAVEAACTRCEKGFLPQNGYLWSIGRDEEIRRSLITVLKKIYMEYRCHKNVDEELMVLKNLALLSPLDEQCQLLYLNTLKIREMGNEITRHCEWLKATLTVDYDTKVSKKIECLLKESKEGI